MDIHVGIACYWWVTSISMRGPLTLTANKGRPSFSNQPHRQEVFFLEKRFTLLLRRQIRFDTDFDQLVSPARQLSTELSTDKPIEQKNQSENFIRRSFLCALLG